MTLGRAVSPRGPNHGCRKELKFAELGAMKPKEPSGRLQVSLPVAEGIIRSRSTKDMVLTLNKGVNGSNMETVG